MDSYIYTNLFILMWKVSTMRTQNINYEMNGPLLHKLSVFIFQQERHWTCFSSTIYNLLYYEPSIHVIWWNKAKKLEETTTSNVPLNLKGPFCASNFSLKILIVFLHVHTRVKQYLSLIYIHIYIVHAKASNNTPSCTHVILYMVWRVHPLRHFFLYKLRING